MHPVHDLRNHFSGFIQAAGNQRMVAVVNKQSMVAIKRAEGTET